MASNNMMNLKVFLRDENTSEARRFTVDASVVTSFLFMKEKLQTVFPILRDRDFKITWKDSDGDEITIASDEDFITAFTEMSGNVKVLYVTVIKSNREPIFMMDAEVQDTSYHGPRVICDVCNQLITGFRYKCVQCPDYDLCAGCEHQGHHSDHLMIRVPNNESYMPKCARKFMHHFARNLKKSAYAASKEAYRAAKYASKFTSAKPSTEEEKTDQPQPSTSNTNQSTEERQGGCPFTPGEGINMNDVHALGAMARQHLGPILEALQTQPQPQNNNSNQADQGGLFFDLIRNAVDGFFGAVPESNTTNQQPPSQTQPEKENVPTKDSTQSSQSDSTPMDVENTTRDGPHVTFAPTSQQSENGQQRRDPGWTFVATNQNQASQNSASENSQNAQATAPAFVYHDNPKIAEGLVQLYEMGFSNDNGILTRLLERFEGNVALVVKALIDMKN
ncbi:hypothetical protein ILUMI_07778 [Ignelater luminosus]|uniref:Sequestosome-1 n=1 Tax=Ignelater luminosus TaxID=2038154 RepID=A0A8K0D850_IGNLU|nr:hypothetical protein ILUMI_07778 [Ignelater luminosus]